jgi:hypothetical protein
VSAGYSRGQGDGLDNLIEDIRAIQRRLRELEIPTGTQTASLVQQVQAKLAELDATVNALVASALGNYYTKAQTDSKVTSPGNIAPANVTASGTVSGNYGGNFPAGLQSTGAYNTLVTGGGAYVAAWIHNDGRIGYAPSSRRFKTGFKPVALTIETVLRLQGFYFQYLAMAPYDQEQQRVMIGLLAEDTHGAGFPWLVDYDENGDPFGIRNDLLSVVVLEGMRDFFGQFVELRDRVGRLELAV